MQHDQNYAGVTGLTGRELGGAHVMEETREARKKKRALFLALRISFLTCADPPTHAPC